MRPVVLITGGSNGIGASSAIDFASRGYDVVINYNTSYQNAIEIENYIKAHFNVNVLIIKADVSSEYEVVAMVENIIEKFGRIDVLVNNAGVKKNAPLMSKKVDDFRKTLSVNLIGTFIVSKYVSKWMMEQKSGKIINVAASISNEPECIDYDVSKAGVITLTKTFANYLSPYVTVNAVAPGKVDTNLNRELEIGVIEKETEKILLKRFAESSEISKVICFLASDDAGYINGEVITVDGGK